MLHHRMLDTAPLIFINGNKEMCINIRNHALSQTYYLWLKINMLMFSDIYSYQLAQKTHNLRVVQYVMSFEFDHTPHVILV